MSPLCHLIKVKLYFEEQYIDSNNIPNSLERVTDCMIVKTTDDIEVLYFSFVAKNVAILSCRIGNVNRIVQIRLGR